MDKRLPRNGSSSRRHFNSGLEPMRTLNLPVIMGIWNLVNVGDLKKTSFLQNLLKSIDRKRKKKCECLPVPNLDLELG